MQKHGNCPICLHFQSGFITGYFVSVSVMFYLLMARKIDSRRSYTLVLSHESQRLRPRYIFPLCSLRSVLICVQDILESLRKSMIIVLERLSFNLMAVLTNVVLFPLDSIFVFLIWKNGSINFCQLEVLDLLFLLQVLELWIMRKLDENTLLAKSLGFSTRYLSRSE